MEVNPAQLLENGYIVLPGVIAPEQARPSASQL
jgi:hypothetical protein